LFRTLYVGDDFESRYPVRAAFGRPVWRRCILCRPAGGDWLLWRASASSHVKGINGGVDVLRTGGLTR
jgi:hypothetical protein